MAGGDVVNVVLDGVAPHCQPDATGRIVTPSGGIDTLRFAVGCFGDLVFIEEQPSFDWRIRYLDTLGKIRTLAEAPGRQFLEDWSHDGNRLLYTSNEHGDRVITNLSGWDVAHVDVRTGAIVWLATSPFGDHVPKWSPDGSRVAYHRYYLGSGGANDSVLIYVVDADGTGTRQMLPSPGIDLDPDWVLNGSALVFGCFRYHYQGSLCRAGPDGVGLTALVPEQWVPQHVRASPQSDWVSYLSHTGYQAIWTIPASGGTPVRLTPMVTISARWHPDGLRLVVDVVEGTNPYTYGTRVVSRDGTSLSPNLIPFATYPGGSAWSPDGQWLLVSANVPSSEKDQNLYVLKPDGSGPRKITFGPSPKFRPLWRPNGRFVPPPPWVTFAPLAAPAAATSALREPPAGTCFGRVGTGMGPIPCEELSRMR
jgi:Tol biopolymer transport system component